MKLLLNGTKKTGLKNISNIMFKFKLWVRINDYQTAHTIVWASNALEAKQLGEAQYGAGNVLNYTQVDE